MVFDARKVATKGGCFCSARSPNVFVGGVPGVDFVLLRLPRGPNRLTATGLVCFLFGGVALGSIGDGFGVCWCSFVGVGPAMPKRR